MLYIVYSANCVFHCHANYIVGGFDFMTVARSDIFSADQRRQCVNVFIFGDDIPEETESFTLILYSRVSSVMIDPNITEIFILDDDGMKYCLW